MKTLQTILVLSSLLFFSSQISAQSNPDLGVRLTTSDYSRFQLEFRKPLSEKYTFRIGSSLGLGNGYHYDVVSASNDSVVTMREKVQWGYYGDLRFGLERNLKWKNFSLHADLILGYRRIEHQNWNSFSMLDSNNVWTSLNYDPYNSGNPLDVAAKSTEHYFGGGLCAGISYNIPLSNRFILNLNANYTGMVLFTVAYNETADLLNEFNDGSGTTFELYANAGIGLRYVFGKK